MQLRIYFFRSVRQFNSVLDMAGYKKLPGRSRKYYYYRQLDDLCTVWFNKESAEVTFHTDDGIDLIQSDTKMFIKYAAPFLQAAGVHMSSFDSLIEGRRQGCEEFASFRSNSYSAFSQIKYRQGFEIVIGSEGFDDSLWKKIAA